MHWWTCFKRHMVTLFMREQEMDRFLLFLPRTVFQNCLSAAWLQLNKATCQHVAGGAGGGQHPSPVSASRPRCWVSRGPKGAGGSVLATLALAGLMPMACWADGELERLGGRGQRSWDAARRGRDWTALRCTARRLLAGVSAARAGELSTQPPLVLPWEDGAWYPPVGWSEDGQGQLSSPGQLHGFQGHVVFSIFVLLA